MARDGDSFLGTGWGFPPTFVRATGTVGMTSDEDDIRSSLQILLSTDVGERVMQPKYGCDLRRLVFEPLDATLEAYVKDLIGTAILYFESRIILDRIILAPDATEGRLLITLEYRVAATNTRNNFVYPYYVGEATEMRR